MKFLKTISGPLVMVDDHDLGKVSSYRYHIVKNSGVVQRAIYSKKLKRTVGRKGLAQDILKVPSHKIVVFKNGSKLDCRRSNLMIIPVSKRNLSAGVSYSNKTGYKGVSYKKSTKKYEAYIRVKYKKHNLGSFRTAREAAEAYNEAAVKYFGEDFANLNRF